MTSFWVLDNLTYLQLVAKWPAIMWLPFAILSAGFPRKAIGKPEGKVANWETSDLTSISSACQGISPPFHSGSVHARKTNHKSGKNTTKHKPFRMLVFASIFLFSGLPEEGKILANGNVLKGLQGWCSLTFSPVIRSISPPILEEWASNLTKTLIIILLGGAGTGHSPWHLMITIGSLSGPG